VPNSRQTAEKDWQFRPTDLVAGRQCSAREGRSQNDPIPVTHRFRLIKTSHYLLTLNMLVRTRAA